MPLRNVLDLIDLPDPGTCSWWEDAQGEWWETGCDNAHCFTGGGPTENSYRFCPYCGDRLVVEGE